MIKIEDPEERSKSRAKWNMQMHWMWASKKNWSGKDHRRDEEGSAKQDGPISENEPTWNQFGKRYCLQVVPVAAYVMNVSNLQKQGIWAVLR